MHSFNHKNDITSVLHRHMPVHNSTSTKYRASGPCQQDHNHCSATGSPWAVARTAFLSWWIHYRDWPRDPIDCRKRTRGAGWSCAEAQHMTPARTMSQLALRFITRYSERIYLWLTGRRPTIWPIYSNTAGHWRRLGASFG